MRRTDSEATLRLGCFSADESEEPGDSGSTSAGTGSMELEDDDSEPVQGCAEPPKVPSEELQAATPVEASAEAKDERAECATKANQEKSEEPQAATPAETPVEAKNERAGGAAQANQRKGEQEELQAATAGETPVEDKKEVKNKRAKCVAKKDSKELPVAAKTKRAERVKKSEELHATGEMPVKALEAKKDQKNEELQAAPTGKTPAEATPECSGGDGSGRKRRTPSEKRRVHRKACERWHEKWLQKGVPRNPTSTKATSSDDKAKGKNKRAKRATKANQKKEGVQKRGKRDLRTEKASFIREFVDKFTGVEVGQERVLLANKAWMESETRANFMSAKAGRQLI